MGNLFTAIKRVLSYSLLLIFCAFLASSSTAFAATVSSDNSPNWSGYVDTGHAFTKVQGDITVPTITCTVPGAQTYFWVGFDGYTSNDPNLEQVGIGAQCSNATHPTVSYFGWWEMKDGNTGNYINKIATSRLHITPGNRVAAILAVKPGTNEFNLELYNTTTKQTPFRLTVGGYSTARQSAEWIVERPNVNGTLTALAKWNPNSSLFAYAEVTTTTNATLKSVSYYDNTALEMTATRSGGRVLDLINALNGNGTSFGVTWQST
jgi:hypothetical protein